MASWCVSVASRLAAAVELAAAAMPAAVPAKGLGAAIAGPAALAPTPARVRVHVRTRRAARLPSTEFPFAWHLWNSSEIQVLRIA
eukprot:1159892-Pelagomonas_calceolata.AAC.3